MIDQTVFYGPNVLTNIPILIFLITDRRDK